MSYRKSQRGSRSPWSSIERHASRFRPSPCPAAARAHARGILLDRLMLRPDNPTIGSDTLSDRNGVPVYHERVIGPAPAQTLHQRRLVHDGAAGRVDENGAALHASKFCRAEQVARLAGQREMNRHETGLRQDAIQQPTRRRAASLRPDAAPGRAPTPAAASRKGRARTAAARALLPNPIKMS